ncbi:MAG: Dabb family protein [Pseudomonadota bacterium]
MRAGLLIGSFLTLASCASSAAEEAQTVEPLLTHAVFFDLKNDDAASIQALVDGCYEYLAPHDGIVYFSAGARHLDYERDVNDLGFDVALTIVFESTAAQDAYQVTEPHLQFIEEFNQNWASVRVFDSLAPSVPE